MVELYLNNQKVDLRGNETIATDYSIAPIGNIASRGSAKSVTFKLPLTAHNRAIIENANVIVNGSILPYHFIPARLTANGLNQKISSAQLKEVSDEISITLFGSNVDFFSIIKQRNLSDLGDVWDHDWTVANAYLSRNNTSGYIYAMIDFNADDYMDVSAQEIDVRALLPSVFLHSMISEIITQAGFTAEGDFMLNADYRNVIIPCFDKKLGRYGDLLKSTAVTSADILLYDADNMTIDTFVPVFDPLNLFATETYNIDFLFATLLRTSSRYEVAAAANYTYRFHVVLNYTASTAAALDVILVRQDVFGTAHPIRTKTIISTSGTLEFNELVDCVAGDRIHIISPQIGSAIDSIIIQAGSTFEVTEVTGETYNNTFDVTANLPDMKQSDLLKDTAQKFGLIFQVDNIRKVVQVKQFSEIIANIPQALDWSDKVDYSEKPVIQFNPDYAQRSTCTYEDDDTVTKPIGTDSEIIIDNDHLKLEDKLFESPFAASELVQRFGNVSIAQIKLFTNRLQADEEIADLEPRYLIRRSELFSVFTYTDSSSTGTFYGAMIPVTHFILPGMDFNAGFEDSLLDQSSDLIELIQEFKTVKMLMRITAADINQLDFFTPVWIQLTGQSGAYFYISEIKQFKVTSKESTDVELVKLP